jgi:nicotinate dehydrogenase subunit B
MTGEFWSGERIAICHTNQIPPSAPWKETAPTTNQLGLGLAVTGQAKLKDPKAFKIIGRSPPRRDLPGKVFGTLEMAPDVRLPGMLHARMIRPKVAGAVPVKVDEESIKDIPGAKAVWIKDLLAVVAEKEWNAVRAAQKLTVTWSDSRPGFPGHDGLHAHIRNAPVVKREFQVQNGDFDEGIRQAARIIEGEYEFPTQSHSSTGPACAVADVRDGECTLYTSTQKPHYAAEGVAELLGLPRDKVRAIWMFGTGSYGRNDQGTPRQTPPCCRGISADPCGCSTCATRVSRGIPRGPPRSTAAGSG